MTRLIEWLLNLEPSSLAGEGSLAIRFATPPAPWIMLIGAVVAAVYVIRIYRREPLPLRWKSVLVALRFGAVMTILFILAQPLIVLRRTQLERGHVAVLVDCSASMSVADGDSPGASNSPNESKQLTRLDTALGALKPQHGALREALRDHDVSIWAFSQAPNRLTDLQLAQGTVVADAPRTDMAAALTGVMEALPSARLASIVLVSDGRQTAPVSLEGALAQATARRVPIHTIGVGSWQPVRDVRVDSVWHDDDVFVNDSVTLRVQLDLRGIDESTEAMLELKDPESGALLSSYRGRLSVGERHASWDLLYRPGATGRRSLEVVVRPIRGEADLTNNAAFVSIRAHEQKLRVLYVEGYPRFEYRFLKNLLVREPTIESSCLLLSATAGFAQEGGRPVTRFPASLDELSAFDVVLLGDVDARREEWISRAQQQWLVEFVSTMGGGFGVIAGPQHIPHVLRQTTIEKLLPVVLDSQWTPRADQTWSESFRPHVTAEGEQSGLFQFTADRERNAQIVDALPAWYYIARVLGAQPGASILATLGASERDAMPVIAMGRYGAGRTLFVGTDDLWRWREYDGDRYYETFWLGAIRSLARGRKLGIDRPWRLETDRKRYEVGESVRMRLTVHDPAGRNSSEDVDVLVSDRAGAVDRAILRPERPAEGIWEGTFVAETPGSLVLSAGGGPLVSASEPQTCVVEVQPVDPESREPSADRETLNLIAERTGARAQWVTDGFAELVRAIPDRSLETPDDVERPMWDTRLIVLMMTVFLTGEWVIRRAVSLP